MLKKTDGESRGTSLVAGASLSAYSDIQGDGPTSFCSLQGRLCLKYKLPVKTMLTVHNLLLLLFMAGLIKYQKMGRMCLSYKFSFNPMLMVCNLLFFQFMASIIKD